MRSDNVGDDEKAPVVCPFGLAAELKSYDKVGDKIAGRETESADEQRRKPLFHDFEEKCAERNKLVEAYKQHEQRQEAIALTKHPKALKATSSTCVKSIFYWQMKQETAKTPGESECEVAEAATSTGDDHDMDW